MVARIACQYGGGMSFVAIATELLRALVWRNAGYAINRLWFGPGICPKQPASGTSWTLCKKLIRHGAATDLELHHGVVQLQERDN